MYRTNFEGIAFIEGVPTKYEAIQPASVEIGGVVSQSQLKTLDDVKRKLAQAAKAAGGNAIVDFKYGQKSVGWFRSIMQLDDVNWYGSGMIAIIPRNAPPKASK